MASNLAYAYPIEPTGLTLVPTVTVSFNADLCARFIDYVDRKPTTVKGYVTCLRQFAKWLKASGIEQVTRNDIRAYRDYLAASDLKEGTQAQYLRAVRHLCAWVASETGQPSIADNIHGAKVDNSVHKRDDVPRDAVSKITASIDTTTEDGKRALAMVLLCVDCGTRCVELSRLNCADIKTIDGEKQIFIHGKGRDGADRAEALIGPVAEAIDDYLAHRAEPVKAKSPLFTSTSNRNKGGRIAPTTISTMLKRVLQGAGYDSDRLTAHSFRHSCGTGAVKTLGIYEAQKALGHKSPDTTMRYVHDDDDIKADREAREAIHGYFFGNGTAQPIMPALQKAITTLTQDEQAAVLAFIKTMKGAN